MANIEKTEFNIVPSGGQVSETGRPKNAPVDARQQAGENDAETTLRPRSIEEFIGQPKVRGQLNLVLTGAKNVVLLQTTCCCLAHLVWEKQRWQ